MRRRPWLLLICWAGAGGHARHDERAAPTAASALAAPRPSATALAPTPSASTALPAASEAGQATAEPGVLLGPNYPKAPA